MSQATDYSLANQSGANFRSELNTILGAVVSQNSGATAPSTTYAFQPWIDTGVTPALLKFRNSANNGWVTIGDVTTANMGLATLASPTFTGTVTIPAGASISGFATLASPTFTGTVTIPAGASISGFAPLASPTFTGTVTIPAGASISGFAPLASPTFTGTVTIPAGASISGFAALASAQTFTAQQRGTISALTDGATITPDFAVANNFSVTLGGNRTLANPSNLTAGASGCIWITQDGTGSRTLAYGSYWDFTGGTAPTLTTTAAAVDCLVYSVQSSTKITATLITNLS